MPQIHKTKNENEDITANINVVDTHLKNLNSKNMEILKEMDEFLDSYDLSKLNEN